MITADGATSWGERMVRTYASFEWNISIAPEAMQPYAEADVARLVASFRTVALDVTDPEDGEYAWDFRARLPHIEMHCQLGLVENKQWLLACNPHRGLLNWMLSRYWESEQQAFVESLHKCLLVDNRISTVQWYTQREWKEMRGSQPNP